MTGSFVPGARTQVGSVLLPPQDMYTTRPADTPITAPDHRPVAQLARMPESLSEFVGIAFSPFSAAKRRPHQMVPPDDRVSFRILSVVEYRGNEGRLQISTVQPSPAALRPGLDLGTPIGSLPGGETLFRMIGEGDLPFQIRWLRNDHIIGMTGDLPVDRLVTLAHEVVAV